jgi:membrane protein implicated in regulation of membrane protease activity
MVALALVLVAGVIAALWASLLLGVGMQWALIAGLACSAAFLIVALVSRTSGDAPEIGGVTSRGRFPRDGFGGLR